MPLWHIAVQTHLDWVSNSYISLPLHHSSVSCTLDVARSSMLAPFPGHLRPQAPSKNAYTGKGSWHIQIPERRPGIWCVYITALIGQGILRNRLWWSWMMHSRYCIHLCIQYTTSGLSNNSIGFHLFNISAHLGISLFLMGGMEHPNISIHHIVFVYGGHLSIYWATVSILDCPDISIYHTDPVLCVHP